MIILIFVLIQLICLSNGIEDFNECKTDSSNNSLTPELHLRYSKVLYIEVYYSSHLCDFTYLKPYDEVKNPSCLIENGPLDEHPELKVEFLNVTSWESGKGRKYEDNLHFNIERALFQIPSNPAGSITCELTVSGKPPIRTHFRRIAEEPTLFLTTTYTPNLCNVGECTEDIFRKASRNLKRSLNSSTIRGIEPMVTDYHVDSSGNSSQRVIFRVKQSSPGIYSVTMDNSFLQSVTALVQRRSDPWPRVDAVRSSRACPEDGPWPATAAGRAARPLRPHEGCDTLMRRCIEDGEWLGAEWAAEEAVGDAQECISTRHSQMLQEVLTKIKTTAEGAGTKEIQDIEMILDNITDSTLSKTDIWNIADVLENVRDTRKLTPQSIPSITNVVNRLLILNEYKRGESLKYMQGKAGTSNILLQTLDNILGKAPLHGANVELVMKERLTTLVTDIDWKNETLIPGGFSVMHQNKESANSMKIIQLPRNTSLQWLSQQEISAAVLLPESLLSSLGNGSHRLVLSVFFDSKLFGDETTHITSGHIIGISIDGKHIQLKDPIILLFRKHNPTSKNTSFLPDVNPCSFWDFEADNGVGEWSQAGCTLALHSGNKTDICVCTHLTHFGKLLYNTGMDNMRTYDNQSLSIITVIGCSLSLIGLIGVFLTATMFPEKGTGRSLQLQLCGAQALLMIGVLWDTVSHPVEDSLLCLLRGLLLHWSVLALSLWTLAAALYQHRRLTQPLHALKTNPKFLPLATVISWALPMVVCLLLAFFSSEAYKPPTCYPFGIELFLSVILPIGCIIVANSVLFSLIIWSICDCSPNSPKLRNSQNNNNARTIRKVVASAYLFCLLGLCWLFGFLQWQYLFCITASLQGVSHFVFCVILDRATRRSWKLYKKRRQLQLSSIKSWTHTSLLLRSN